MTQSESTSIRVSVIVPCYKVEEYLPRCLDSLLAQTLKNIEIICVNDGSPDRCIDILRDYKRRYPEQIVIIDKPNEGVWRGRFDGIRIARGKYIGFLDSDDYAEPGFLECLYKAAKTADADVSICGFSRVDMETGKKLTREMCLKRTPFIIDENPGRLIEINGAPWNKLWRAPILKGMHDLEAPPKIMDDMLFQMLAFLNMHGKIVFTPENVINYMVRSDSIINTISVEKLQTAYDAFLAVRKYYVDELASDELLQAFDALAFEHLGVSMMFRVSCDKSINFAEQLKKCTDFLDTHFPTWRHNPYITHRYARKYGRSFHKLNISQKMFRAHLMRPFLAAYRFAIDKLHFDVKW